LRVGFDLNIDPVRLLNGSMDYRISLHEVSVTASRMSTISTAVTQPVLEHLFVTEETWIIVGPSEGACLGPRAALPHMREFFSRFSDSSSWQGQVTIGAPTNITGNLSHARTRLTERPPITSEVVPVSFGSGARQDFEWRYQMRPGSTDTLVEFSSSNPPTHHVTYVRPVNAASPEDIKVMLKAVFRQRGKLVRFKNYGTFPPSLRFFGDRRFRHLVVMLEARIGEEGGDDFQFPGPHKRGSDLAINLNINKGRIWHGNQDELGDRTVRSKLDSPPFL
jgi:hypothetical protein